jgi:thioester reductase-like protein
MTTQLESTITAVAARCLGSTLPLDPATSFERLGLDSLATIELAAALEAELGCELPADVLAGCVDARTLAARLARDGIGARQHQDPFEQMFADAILPDDVRPECAVASSTDLRTARRILLTGSTGFLGRALLDELLQTTTAEIVCLVRPTPGRLKPAHHRVQLVAGDLSHPRLGLSEDGCARLSGDLDAVLHCGAAVNWVFGYPALRAANVLGTLELLRLASRSGAAFHFISSLSVCYSTSGPRIADESFDGMSALRGIHLGYAQTKVVAESLVRQAGERGLPVRVYRPALISGHSATGAFNRDDLISALVRGCVAMATAPDLDWNLDCEPVDVVAPAIVRLSRARGPVFHIGHQRPRHWRECVLWMRMYGYDVKLVSYHQWLRQLERETRPGDAGSSSHPLRPLRSFFLDRPTGAGGLTQPELHEERRRTQACSAATRALLRETVRDVPLDASLLETYFRAFRTAGDLPEPGTTAADHVRVAGERLSIDEVFLTPLLGPVSNVEILGSGSDHSIVSELTAWRSGSTAGLFRVRMLDASMHAATAMVKVKAHDSDVIAVGEALADLVDPAVGREYRRFSGRIGFSGAHRREIDIYRQQDARFRRHAPALLGSVTDDATRMWVAAIEYVNDAVVADPAATSPWHSPHIARALDGLAELHGIWLDRDAELSAQPWIGYVQSADDMREMAPLWSALAGHAAPLFASWTDRELVAIQRRLISKLPSWWPALESGPRTLIHNDFNPRNICLRGPDATLCAYDWELATLGAPQRDLAEFLCFALPESVREAQVIDWSEYLCAALERQRGRPIDREQWTAGFRSGLYDFLINRLSIYAVVHRVRRQPFLPRVVRTWRHLYQMFPLEAAV